MMVPKIHNLTPAQPYSNSEDTEQNGHDSGDGAGQDSDASEVVRACVIGMLKDTTDTSWQFIVRKQQQKRHESCRGWYIPLW